MKVIHILFLLLACLLCGCGGGDGGSEVNSIAETIANPTGSLPAHVNWDSYNLYQYQPGAQGQWVKFVTLGEVTGNLPVLGDNPVMFAHGLGGSIKDNEFVPLAQNLFDNNLTSCVIGFEYDSQDGIQKNGTFFTQALDLINPTNGSPPTWAFVCHSMGGLVCRSALQGVTLPIALTGNRVITLGTPHYGSPVANAVQNTDDPVVRTAVIVALDQGGFDNADGNPCEADVTLQGFTDLRTDSAFLANLNANIADHPQVEYFTVAGTVKGTSFSAADDLLGVSTDDGMVTIASANPPELGAVNSGLAPVDHIMLPTDATTVFPFVRGFLTQ